ncbi:hypothetical protein CLOBOL_04505 [Enterocloster bolteae ATCC BAA-613]|uniref:Uncharacterized protein n=1 Tax=Enterocloster bolteae (strain ATCC BAA-613 / DSM 15670 / CCUG 46953 / JCM 12243 / WAL 16351) TaxID=411902 RepID=A8RW89_ENTBW|nr:hypothetical protein CLOBOL_04505 [Enterocloster bolteae ATCC BAA-613]
MYYNFLSADRIRPSFKSNGFPSKSQCLGKRTVKKEALYIVHYSAFCLFVNSVSHNRAAYSR